jgi:RNA polymerase sigma factor (sigma-70 family)
MSINYPQTRATMIDRLVAADGSREWNRAWESFVEIYSPAIKQAIVQAFNAVGWSKVSAETLDWVQSDVTLKFLKASKTFKYDPSKGKFRAFLFTIVKRCVFDHMTAHNRHPDSKNRVPSENGDAYEREIDPQANFNHPEKPDDECDRTWKMATFRTMLEEVGNRVGPKTMLIFRKTKIEQLAASDVIKDLNVTRSTIDNANLRVMKILEELAQTSPYKEELQ